MGLGDLKQWFIDSGPCLALRCWPELQTLPACERHSARAVARLRGHPHQRGLLPGPALDRAPLILTFDRGGPGGVERAGEWVRQTLYPCRAPLRTPLGVLFSDDDQCPQVGELQLSFPMTFESGMAGRDAGHTPAVCRPSRARRAKLTDRDKAEAPVLLAPSVSIFLDSSQIKAHT
jgi:hypothetical protein